MAAEVAGNAIREALEPILAVLNSMEESAVEFLRRTQPDDAAGMTDAEIASLVHPDESRCFTDGSQHKAKYITVGDLRRARTAYDAIGSGVKAETAACFIQRSTLAELRKDKTATTTVCSPLLKQPFGDPVALYTKEAFQLSTHTAANARPSDDRLWDQTLTERDNYHDAADKLAEAIGELLGVEVGEHSSAHSPWESALEHAGQAVRNREISTHTAAGAGPMGEAVAWRWEWQAGGYRVAEDEFTQNAELAEQWRTHPQTLAVVPLRPVEEPGEVKRLTRERDEMEDKANRRVNAAYASMREDNDARRKAEAELASTRVALNRMVTLYESEFDPETIPPRPDWLTAALGDAQEGGR